MSAPSLETIAALMQAVADNVEQMREEQREIRAEINVIRRVDVEHAHTAKALGRAFDEIKRIDQIIAALDAQIPERLLERLLAIETHQPNQKLSSTVVLRGVAAVLTLLLAFFFGKTVDSNPASVIHSQQPSQPSPTSPATSSPR
ncbi:MAG: hypothetical protein ACRC2H_01055 [Silanimonas sp.]